MSLRAIPCPVRIPLGSLAPTRISSHHAEALSATGMAPFASQRSLVLWGRGNLQVCAAEVATTLPLHTRRTSSTEHYQSRRTARREGGRTTQTKDVTSVTHELTSCDIIAPNPIHIVSRQSSVVLPRSRV